MSRLFAPFTPFAPVAAALLSLCLALPAFAHTEQEIRQDAKRHRAMAAAHEAAARCLESGRKPEDCNKDLQAACKGLAIGRYCGMKHEH